MKNHWLKLIGSFLMVGAVFATAGAKAANPVSFPDRDSASVKEGTFVSPENLRAVGKGLTKTQMYALLGTPHFNEGVFNVKAWNYIFNFRQDSRVIACQFQVEYNDAKHVSATYWNSADCANFVNPAPVAVSVAAAPPVQQQVSVKAQAPTRYSLSGDALFAFGKSSVASLSASGKRELDRIIADLVTKGSPASRIVITGHTDRIGSAAVNLRLSSMRASSVRDYLMQHGVDRQVMKVRGVGASESVVDCPGKKTPAVVACLAPNRRVTVDIGNAS